MRCHEVDLGVAAGAIDQMVIIGAQKLLRVMQNQFTEGYINYYSADAGTNSTFITSPIPAAKRLRVLSDGFPLPFSNLLMSA